MESEEVCLHPNAQQKTP